MNLKLKLQPKTFFIKDLKPGNGFVYQDNRTKPFLVIQSINDRNAFFLDGSIMFDTKDLIYSLSLCDCTNILTDKTELVEKVNIEMVVTNDN